jgi:predicted membrane channel-forming protein YqfA (hemolysin III family)
MKYNVPASLAPRYMQYSNILSGYRVGGTYMDCFESLFRWHNETSNIWTMIICLCSVTSFILYTVFTFEMDEYDELVFVMLLMCHVIHLPLSIACHLFVPINMNVADFWRKCDVGAIYLVGILKSISLSYHSFSLLGFVFNSENSSKVLMLNSEGKFCMLTKKEINSLTENSSIISL